MAGRPLPLDSQELLREQAWLCALARSLVTSADAAEDVVQETWLAALERPPTGRERPQIRAFLATVARRVAGSWRRGKAQREARERAASRPEAVAPERDALEWLALQRRLAEAITELSEPYRTVITMRFVEGLAPGEIARRRKETPEAVRTRLSRGLDMLRKRLDRESGGEREAWLSALGGLVLRRGPSATTLAGTLVGVTMGWKSFVAASVLTLALVGWWSRTRSEDSGAEAPARTAAESLRESTPDEAPVLVASARVEGEERVPARRARPALRGRIVSLSDGRPLGGARASLRPEVPRLPDATARDLRELEASIQRGEEVRETARRPRPEERLDDSGAILAVTADADGRFAFEALPVGELALLASAEHHVPTLLRTLEPDDLEREVEIALAPVGSLEVEAVDEAGEPVAGVALAVTIVRDLERGSACFAGVGLGPSGPDGRVWIEGVPCGLELRVEPWPAPRRLAEARAARITLDPAARRGRMRLVVASTGALAGSVQPLPADGVRIEARFRPGSGASSAHSARVGPDGEFLLEKLPVGPGELEVVAIRVGSRATTTIGARRDAVVVPGQVTEVGALELATPVRLAGHVPDWSGSTGDYYVFLRFLRAGKPEAETTIDDEGRFEAWLPPGPCTIEVAHLDRVLGLVTAHAPADDLVLDLLEFCAGLRGEVPETERASTLFFPLLQRSDDSDAALRVSPRPTHAPLRIREGEFRILSLAPGRYSLLAIFGARGSAWIPRLDLEPGRVADLGRLVSGFGALLGRVVDARGAPVGGAELVVESPFDAVLDTHASRKARTADDGTFEVQALPAGPWRVHALHGDALGSSALLDVFPRESVSTEVVLRGSARLSVRVTRDGEPVEDALFVLETAEGLERTERRSSPDGRAELGALVPGEWRWSLQGPSPARSGRLTLRAGESRELMLVLRRNPVRLRLVEPGRSLDALVEALAVSLDADRLDETCGSTQHGSDWFELDLAPGRYLVSARTTDGEVSRQSLGLVEVPADVTALDFVPSALSLSVRAEAAACAASPPMISLLSVDGLPLAARGLPLTLEPTTGGWRCASLPPGATVMLEGAVARTGRVQREIRVNPSGATEIDWP